MQACACMSLCMHEQQSQERERWKKSPEGVTTQAHRTFKQLALAFEHVCSRAHRQGVTEMPLLRQACASLNFLMASRRP